MKRTASSIDLWLLLKSFARKRFLDTFWRWCCLWIRRRRSVLCMRNEMRRSDCFCQSKTRTEVNRTVSVIVSCFSVLSLLFFVLMSSGMRLLFLSITTCLINVSREQQSKVMRGFPSKDTSNCSQRKDSQQIISNCKSSVSSHFKNKVDHRKLFY